MGYVVMVHVPGENPDDDALLDGVLVGLDSAAKYGARTVGLYWLPNRDEETCQGNCPDQKDKKKNGFGRDPEFGYDIHECGKPTRHWRTGVGSRMIPALGYNLLEPEDTPVIFRDSQQLYRLNRK